MASVRSPVEELNDLNNLTQLIYRRNKNQHRHSHWWRHYDNFRRQLHRLCQKSVSTSISSSTSPSRSLRPTSKGGEILTAWVDFSAKIWYHAFSQILAERQFVSLGLTILAILARVFKVTGILDELSHHEVTEEISIGLKDHVNEIAVVTTSVQMGVKHLSDDEIGVPVSRAKITKIEKEVSSFTSARVHGQKASDSQYQAKSASTNPVAIKKHRRVDGDTIDDIFGFLEDTPSSKSKKRRKNQ